MSPLIKLMFIITLIKGCTRYAKLDLFNQNVYIYILYIKILLESKNKYKPISLN